ncbi:transposon Ty3-I Gag-Pol polyprotein [Trichonephila clavipes]|nr:transposon Ty3-I Gag-Pol polyprotein [Trichonephila clavipes]
MSKIFLVFAHITGGTFKNSANITKPSHHLLKKVSMFLWGTSQKESFSCLQKLLTNGPVVGHFLSDAGTKIHTENSGYGIGTVLLQVQGGKKKLIAYASRSLTAAKNIYCKTEMKCMLSSWMSVNLERISSEDPSP